MGQKTHPTGFRTGINKSHKVTWFTSYASFKDVLEEDYKIRKIFETKFQSLYTKAGIVKLEIHRKVNHLELLIYAARSKAIAIDIEQTKIVFELKDNLKTLTNDNKKIRIKVLQVTRSKNESSLVAKSIGNQLEKRIAFRKAIRKTNEMLQKSKIKGFKIQVAGRLNGAEIARAEWSREGRVPLQTLRADISYAIHQANTIHGVLGIKVWIFNRDVI